jgi:hypothetical protein
LGKGSGEWTNTTKMAELIFDAAEQARKTLGVEFSDCTSGSAEKAVPWLMGMTNVAKHKKGGQIA